MSKKLIGGIWLPEAETHLNDYLQKSARETGKGNYQLATLGTMLNYVPPERRNLVLDIGGHVGLWSMHLAKHFKQVIAFEPIPLFRDCFRLNVTQSNVELRNYALGDQNAEFDMSVEEDNSGHTHVLPIEPEKHVQGATLVRTTVKRLDDEEFACVDAMKIDVEGFEPAVLIGAENTIKKHKPVICIEQKPHNFYQWDQFYAARILMTWGAKPVHRVIDDYIFVWE